MRSPNVVLLASFVAATSITACATPDEPEGDGEHDAFPTGKGDGSYEEGSWQAISVLRVANAASLEELQGSISSGGAGLTRNAARAIVGYRNGHDGAADTADDRELTSLRALDAVRHVGPVSFDRLLDFAFEKELAVSSKFACTAASQPGKVFEGQWKNSYDLWDLAMMTTEGEFSDMQDCARSARQASSSVVRFGCYYEPEWTFYEPGYALSFPVDVRTRTTPFTVTITDVTRDDRYVDGYREIAGTESTMTCTPGTPGT